MTQISQQANANSGPGQPLVNFLPVVNLSGKYIPGLGWYQEPMIRTFGFVYQAAVAAGITLDIIPAQAGVFIYVKYVLMVFSVATEIRLNLGGVVVFDYPVVANKEYQLDFGTPGLVKTSVNNSFSVSNPFAITDIHVNAWGSYSNQ